MRIKSDNPVRPNDVATKAYVDAASAPSITVIRGFKGPVPADSEVILEAIMPTGTVPAGMVGSRIVAGVAPTGSVVLSIKRNGVEFATATFAPGGTVATLESAADTAFVANDIVSIVAPADNDATCARIATMIVIL